MEYEKIYSDAYTKKHYETENLIKEFLTNDENLIYDFNTNYNELIKIREEIYKDSKFNISDIYIDLLKNFNEFTSKIQEKPIENTLKLKVLPLYNTYLDKGLISITFEQLIEELANYKSENNAFRIFRNQYHLFEKIYESKDYSKYEIKEYGMILESTDIYKHYFNVKKTKQKNSISSSFILENFEKSFTNEENAILIFLFSEIMKNGGFNTTAEMYHILSFINIKPATSFGNKSSYRSSIEYNALFGRVYELDLNKIDSNQKQRNKELKLILDELLIKLKPHKLKNINKEIEKLKTKISEALS